MEVDSDFEVYECLGRVDRHAVLWDSVVHNLQEALCVCWVGGYEEEIVDEAE